MFFWRWTTQEQSKLRILSQSWSYEGAILSTATQLTALDKYQWSGRITLFVGERLEGTYQQPVWWCSQTTIVMNPAVQHWSLSRHSLLSRVLHNVPGLHMERSARRHRALITWTNLYQCVKAKLTLQHHNHKIVKMRTTDKSHTKHQINSRH